MEVQPCFMWLKAEAEGRGFWLAAESLDLVTKIILSAPLFGVGVRRFRIFGDNLKI
jgi:hypothetical protein